MNTLKKTTIAAALAVLAGLTPGHAWWNKEWTARKPITVDTGKTGTEISEPAGTALVLLRLHQGNFNVFSGEGRNPPTLVGDFNRVEKWKTTKAAAIRDTT